MVKGGEGKGGEAVFVAFTPFEIVGKPRVLRLGAFLPPEPCHTILPIKREERVSQKMVVLRRREGRE